jgi:ribosomal protein S18 acetylase RimI-like enzyme
MTTFEQIQFRQYQPSDNEQVRELHQVALRATGAFAESGEWDNDLNDIEGTYVNNGGDFIVGVLDSKIVAMGAFRRISDTIAELKRMRVKPELQGMGIGRGILAMLEDRVKEKGYAEIQLDTTVNQEAARHLYETSGYTEVRRETKGWPLETIFYHKVLVT